MELTQWFEGSEKPVRTGVYERKFAFGDLYSYWDGYKWHSPTTTLCFAEQLGISTQQNVPWRGVAK